jgi:hypothetical protein
VEVLLQIGPLEVTLTDIARVNPALMLLLRDLFGEEPPPKRFKKTMDYYIV